MMRYMKGIAKEVQSKKSHTEIFDLTYGIHVSPFGSCLIAVSPWGVCYLSFLETKDKTKALQPLKEKWPQARLIQDNSKTKPYIDMIFGSKGSNRPIKLLLQGTSFQIKVWEALMSIPQGTVTTYASLAKSIGKPKAIRAVGIACGKNSIAYLVPCHRVVASNGKLGGYRWGIQRKEAILTWESSQNKK